MCRKGQGRINPLFCNWKKLEDLKVLHRKPPKNWHGLDFPYSQLPIIYDLYQVNFVDNYLHVNPSNKKPKLIS